MKHKILKFKIALLVSIAFATFATAQQSDPVSDTLLPTGRTISPAGKFISFSGRPVDLEIHGDILFAKNHKQLKAIDIGSMAELDSVTIPGGASMYGIACDNNRRVYVSNAKNQIHVYDWKANKLTGAKPIELPSGSYPCGIALSDDGKTMFVCLSKKNSVVEIDLKTGKVTSEIAVGVAPFDCQIGDGHLLVSNIGGRRSTDTDKTAPSAGTPTVIDKRGIASTGTVSIINLADRSDSREIATGLLPTVIDTDKKLAFVCNSNEDTLAVIDLNDADARHVNVKPDKNLPFGSMPNCVRLHEKSKTVLVALAGNNAIAVFNRGPDNQLKLAGHIPTAWYPGSIAFHEDYLLIGSIKGLGARASRRPEKKGRNSHDHQGVIQRIEITDLTNPEKLAAWSEQVETNSRLPQILRNQLLEKSDSNVAAVPIPKKLGQPSTFKHVIYVIKENRTFDQVFGDYDDARSDSNLCIYPRDKTPNHHALADRFGILDNYYCNGVLSADGHSWATEGNVTPYLERSFGGFSRSYTFGDDPITYSSSGFIWDAVLGAGLSFRNYGEMDYAEPPEKMDYHAIYKKYQAGEKITFKQNIGIERLRNYSCRDYPGWNMNIPDVLRMDRFLKEFREFETNDSLPNFCIVYLPEDHLGARGVTSNAHMADNDLALGRLVEAVSKSKFWKDTVIFVNEDDPQNGFDHIDGHRSICLVISPYSQPGINHHFYNQTSVLRTMLHIFGLPPLNQQDASAPLMRECFTSTSNLEPYTAIKPETPLNESPNQKSSWSPAEQKWRAIVATVPIERTGMKTEVDEDNLNRFIWHEAKGWLTPYPESLAGAHATGLQKLRLTLDPDATED